MANGRPIDGDEVDDLFDYDIEANDPFKDDYQPPAALKEKGKNSLVNDAATKIGSGLGLDEEIKIHRKPRAPRVKLDEKLLLSAAGIPKLQSRAKILKFKGKGHEYSDASRLLNFYQIWLDDIFPKAKFLDAAAMVEKQGHKKQIQAMRMEWIKDHQDTSEARESSPGRVAQVNGPLIEERLRTPETTAQAEDDIYNATPKSRNAQVSHSLQSNPLTLDSQGLHVENDPFEDELDDLLAASSNSPTKNIQHQTFSSNQPSNENDPSEDELDDLLLISSNSLSKNPVTSSAPKLTENQFDDDEQAMAEMELDW